MTPPALTATRGREYRLERNISPHNPVWEPVTLAGTPEALHGGWGTLDAARAAAHGLNYKDGHLRITSRPLAPLTVEACW